MALQDDVNILTAEVQAREPFLSTTAAGFDGEPNATGAGAILQNSPAGTWYQRSNGLFYRKAAAAAKSWILASKHADTTAEDFTVSYDSGTAADPVAGVNIRDQESADAAGTFKTLQALIDALPTHMIHVVTVEVADGTHSEADFPDLSRLRFGQSGTSGFAPVVASLRFTSASGLVQATGAPASMPMTSATAFGCTLTSDPSLGVDAYAGFLVTITSGTSAGLTRPVRAHATTTIEVAGKFAGDATSVAQFQQPAAALEFTTFVPSIRNGDANNIKYGIVEFDAIDITNSNSFAVINVSGVTVKLSGGARILGTQVALAVANLIHDLSVIDSVSTSFIGPVAVNAGLFRTSTGTDGPILIRAPSGQPGIQLDGAQGFQGGYGCGSVCNLFGAHAIDGCDPIVQVRGASAQLILAGSPGHVSGELPRHNGTAVDAITLTEGGRAKVDGSMVTFATDGFDGTGTAVDLDNGEVTHTWATLDAAPNKRANTGWGTAAGEAD